ncbi:TPA: hypothetical protein QDZ66_004017 [Pluralibacter gergoviae]|nr:hypothetical protein [Pluralibacter gergoviae]ELC3074144.1 hypothetical protein [Pluralibacter gergoviae]MBK4116714.1 hypothetical protein [Pluralibacter gergoviae]MBL3694450.1 hypothetical protein [Pluralibacter gergoviae]HDS1153211.1 hypothetical protein [Pluralibacter gergoviae]
MSYRQFICCTAALMLVLSYFILPRVLEGVKKNPDIDYMMAHPDRAFDTYSECKKQVADADRCYSAYSAAVLLAETSSCTPSGIERKRKFKRLTEHASNETIEQEIARACPASPPAGSKP